MSRKILFVVLMAIVLGPGSALCDPFLACDLPAITMPVCEVTVDGVLDQSPICAVSADGTVYILIDMAPYGDGSQHQFLARWHDGSGWWSDWSDPFAAGRPGAPGNARLVNQR